jgi:hypothetical protein
MHPGAQILNKSLGDHRYLKNGRAAWSRPTFSITRTNMMYVSAWKASMGTLCMFLGG